MFHLEYKITDADMRAINKRLMWSYFIPYLAVSLLGLGAGIAATVLRPRTEILVLGILLIVLAAVLSVCSLLLLIAPKSFVVSALLTGDDTVRTVDIDADGITVKTADQSDIKLGFYELVRVKNLKQYLLAYLDKDRALVLKDAVTSGGSLSELFEFLKSKIAPPKNQTANAAVSSQEKAAENAVKATDETAEAATADSVESDGNGDVAGDGKSASE